MSLPLKKLRFIEILSRPNDIRYSKAFVFSCELSHPLRWMSWLGSWLWPCPPPRLMSLGSGSCYVTAWPPTHGAWRTSPPRWRSLNGATAPSTRCPRRRRPPDARTPASNTPKAYEPWRWSSEERETEDQFGGGKRERSLWHESQHMPKPWCWRITIYMIIYIQSIYLGYIYIYIYPASPKSWFNEVNWKGTSFTWTSCLSEEAPFCLIHTSVATGAHIDPARIDEKPLKTVAKLSKSRYVTSWGDVVWEPSHVHRIF